MRYQHKCKKSWRQIGYQKIPDHQSVQNLGFRGNPEDTTQPIISCNADDCDVTTADEVSYLNFGKGTEDTDGTIIQYRFFHPS